MHAAERATKEQEKERKQEVMKQESKEANCTKHAISEARKQTFKKQAFEELIWQESKEASYKKAGNR